MKKNILEFCLSPDLGGLELFVVNCYNYFKTQTNCKIMVAPNKKLDKYLENENRDYLIRNKLFPILPALQLAKYIDKNEIDIIHFHWTKDIATIILAKAFSKRKPKIVQTRHMHMTRFKSDFYHKFLYKNIDTMIAVTKLVKDQLTEFIPTSIRPKIETCYIGAQTPTLLNEETRNGLKAKHGINEEFTVAVVGRIEKPKGQHIVLEAVEKLRQNRINAKTLVIGHAMDESYLEELKTNYPNDIFTGFINNASDLMQIASCLVLATQKETFGLVLIEAMKCRICVLGSNQGGPLEIIDDKENGLLFESMNSEDLYTKLNLIVNDAQLKDKLTQKGKEKADIMFDSQTQLKKFKTILESI